MNDVIWLIMRRMRAPLITLLLVYALSVMGMVLIPGANDAGDPVQLNFLDAIYFVAFMSTTIGFGEIPFDFTPAQRLWVTSIIFGSVSTWLYAIGSILTLTQDPRFQRALTYSRFTSRIRRIREPFYIICGAGDTGTQVMDGLARRDIQSVAIDKAEKQTDRLTLNRIGGQIPALTADAAEPDILENAGLAHPSCRGLVATTNDDHANLSAAITTKLLHAELKVLCRCERASVSANMRSFGTDYVFEPFEEFATRMVLALNSPEAHQLQEWLTAMPGSPLPEQISPPQGSWIICGIGRFGSAMASQMVACGLAVTAVDISPEPLRRFENRVVGRGTEEHTLREAGAVDAVGVIAGTDNDIDNLSIIMTALEINSDLFLIARQDEKHNERLFRHGQVNMPVPIQMVAKRSAIVAQRILAVLTTPLLEQFLEYAANRSRAWNRELLATLEPILSDEAPDVWSETVDADQEKAISFCRSHGTEVTVDGLLSDPRNHGDQLPCTILLVRREGGNIMRPPGNMELRPGDDVLLCGHQSAHQQLTWSLADPRTLFYSITGRDLPRSRIWRRFRAV